MSIKSNGLLVGLGFLLGTLGVRAATSKPAKDLYVSALVKGLQAKSAGEELVEQAKSNLDDIVAEANYVNAQQKAAEKAAAAPVSTPAPPKSRSKAKRGSAATA
ncbi:MAG: DUF6110 family protein [Coriobacteriales bacterium]|jgi:hypothetical protein|nr:DUF6110 family protein [Coriobacteriales bacterium]